jgi:hypothetical protein
MPPSSITLINPEFVASCILNNRRIGWSWLKQLEFATRKRYEVSAYVNLAKQSWRRMDKQTPCPRLYVATPCTLQISLTSHSLCHKCTHLTLVTYTYIHTYTRTIWIENASCCPSLRKWLKVSNVCSDLSGSSTWMVRVRASRTPDVVREVQHVSNNNSDAWIIVYLASRSKVMSYMK